MQCSTKPGLHGHRRLHNRSQGPTVPQVHRPIGPMGRTVTPYQAPSTGETPNRYHQATPRATGAPELRTIPGVEERSDRADQAGEES